MAAPNTERNAPKRAWSPQPLESMVQKVVQPYHAIPAWLINEQDPPAGDSVACVLEACGATQRWNALPKHGAPPPAPGKIGHKPVASSSSSTVGEQHRKNKRKHERGSGSPGKLQKKEISHVQCRACQVWVRTDKTGITPERAAELWDYYCTECVAANKIPCRLCTQPLASFGNPTVTLLGCQMTRLRDRGQTYYNTKPAHEACAHTHGLPFCGACKLYATDAVTGRATYCPACRVPFV